MYFEVWAILFMTMFVLSIFLRIAVKVRLFIPLLYMFVVMVFFREWASQNGALNDGIFIGLTVICLGSWIFTCIRKIREWRMSRMNEKLIKEEYLRRVREAKENGTRTIKTDDLYGD